MKSVTTNNKNHHGDKTKLNTNHTKIVYSSNTSIKTSAQRHLAAEFDKAAVFRWTEKD